MAASFISLPNHQTEAHLAECDDGFEQLDELVQKPTRGFQLVHVAPGLAGTLARHLERRAQHAARRVICIDAVASCEPWREAARRLGVQAGDPRTVAWRIVRAAGDAVLLVCAPTTTRWGTAVADAVADFSGDGEVSAWIVELSSGRQCPHAEPLVVGDAASAHDVENFWQALWRAERSTGRWPCDRLQHLERGWLNARDAEPLEVRQSDAARTALRRLALCGRSVAHDGLRELGIAQACDELLRCGLVAADRSRRLWVRSNAQGASGSGAVDPADSRAEDVRAVARFLGETDDAWDGLRAAELLLSVDDVAGGLGFAERALFRASATVREDLWHRLEQALTGVEATPAQLLRLSGIGLELGDGDQAWRLARKASGHEGQGAESVHALLALAKATAARGDLVTAEAMLERAMEHAPDRPTQLEATVELAELLCRAGAHERARTLAERVVEGGPKPSTCLSARSVLGKLLLAEGAWERAQLAFRADAHFAAQSGLIQAELRAQLNWAAALVGAGRRSEARSMLEAIMENADREGVLRAKAFAASNLAVLASQRHAYAEALSLRENAIVAFRRIGNRQWLARSMIYLADLRLDLGFVDEADQALVFARRVLGRVVPPAEAAWMSLVTSRIHLERRRVGQAMAEIDAAICSAAQSTDGTMLADCHCFAARVALADGDAGRAHSEIELARRAQGGSNMQAELALLQARVARTRRQSFVAPARRALALARACKDRLRMAEAHTLLHYAACDAGDAEGSCCDLEAARGLLHGIGASLPAHLRTRFDDRVERLGVGAEGSAAIASGDEGGPVSDRRRADFVQGPPSTRRRGQGPRGAMVGSHESMLAMFAVLEKVASTDVTVLVSGESGTGKELVADAIHGQSARRGGPLVKVNCAALVSTLLMSELFGHELGAFTGATSQRRGCFEHADGGTIFLDEIGDISAATQAALLRVLQDRTFHRVGGTVPVKVNVRVICATHRNLQEMVEAGTFREDLYYRLSGMVLAVPPLRDRLADLPLLSSEILLRMSRQNDVPLKRLTADAIALLSAHCWPGNVRELENVLRAAALFADGDVVNAEELRTHAPSMRHAEVEASPSWSPNYARGPGLEDLAPEDAVYAAVRGGTGLRELQKRLEQECIVRALRETDGHVTRAAALLGIKRPRLSQLIKQHNLRDVDGDPS